MWPPLDEDEAIHHGDWNTQLAKLAKEMPDLKPMFMKWKLKSDWVATSEPCMVRKENVTWDGECFSYIATGTKKPPAGWNKRTAIAKEV